MKKSWGFTMLELIVVMVIISLLAMVTLNTFKGTLARSRDTKRISDLNQYRVSLESYGSEHDGLYPIQTNAIGVPAHTTLCTSLGLTAGSCPADERDNAAVCDSGNTCRYWYQSNSDGTSYVLWGALERPDTSGYYWVICSNGKAGEVDSSDIPTSLGACPI